MKKNRSVVIIGAGISGLSLGWFLKEQYGNSIDLKILEASNRTGGWIQTLSENGFLFDQGPKSIRSSGHGQLVLDLVEQLQLNDEILWASPHAKQRYLYLDKKIRKLPTGPLSLLLSRFGGMALKALIKDFFAAKYEGDDESVHAFATRHFGEPVADQFFDSLVSGVYAGDPKMLSLKSSFPFLHALEKDHPCIWRAALKKKSSNNRSPRGIFTFKKGMQTLTDILTNRLSDHIIYDAKISNIKIDKYKILIHFGNKEILVPDKLFAAIPPAQLALLVAEEAPKLAAHLNGIASNSLAVVQIGYNSPVLKQQGFGYLIPRKEGQNLLGVVWDSSAFPGQNSHPEQTRLTAMLGAAGIHNFAALSESTLVDLALKDVEAHMGIGVKPDYIRIKRVHHAIPQYTIGHQERLHAIETHLKQWQGKMSILGNGFYGASVADCIARAKFEATLLTVTIP